MRSLTFDIPGLPKTPNELLGKHWRVRSRHAKSWQAAVLKAVSLRWIGGPAMLVRLTCTRFSSVEPDRDNLHGSFKAAIDGLVKAGVIADDGPEHLVDLSCRWAKAPPKQGFIRIRIEELP